VSHKSLFYYYSTHACTLRYVFIEFGTAEDATFALNEMDNHQLDSKHMLTVIRFTDVERYSNVDEVYVEPKVETYKPRVRVNTS
jgi:translation initiation factor 3 subunit B